jgi:glycosyltransferase involved in cell wall biosynthesis/GT2 family glycosyltransferase
MTQLKTSDPATAIQIDPGPDPLDQPAPPATPILIITPFYNAGPEFTATAESVLQQTFTDWEWLIVDDGSTQPESLAMLAGYEGSDPRLHVIHNTPNRGLSAARNAGVARCQAPYFLQLDADDLLEPTFVEKCLWALESHPEWSFCNSWSVGFGSKEFLWPRGFELGRDFLAENQVTPAAVIRRSADRAIGGHDETIRDGLEDWDYWLNMAAHGLWGGTIPEYLTRYRHHATPTFWPNRDDPRRKVEFRREMRRRYPALWRRGGFPAVRPPLNGAIRHNLPFDVPPPQARQGTRLLLLIPWFSLGGADRFNLSLLEQFAALGGAVTLCATTAGPHPWLPAFLQHSQDYFLLPSFLQPEDYPRFLHYLIAARQIDLVLISNSMLAYSLLPYLRAHCPKTVFVDYNHMATEWLQGGFVRVGLNCQRWLDLNMVSSEQVREWMLAQGAEADRVAVCYTNIDTAVWDAARYDRAATRRELQIPDGVPVILYPARLEPQKRPRVLAEILRELRRVTPDFVCLIAGDGPQHGWLVSTLARHSLKKQTRLLGSVDPQDMPRLMAACDVLLLPSQDEGISLAIFEAMAMGLVPVVADVGGQRELVTPGTGYLVPHGPSEVAEYVQILSRLLAAPQLRREVGRAARERLNANFTIEQMTERLQRLFAMAQRWSVIAPRAALEQAAASDLAAQVVDDLRFERLQERLRNPEPFSPASPGPGLGSRWHRFIYQVKRHLFRPLYYWALRNGFDPIVPLANRLYRMLGWLLK